MRALRHFLHLGRARWPLAALLVALLLPSGASAVIAGPMEPRADMPQEAAARAAYGGLPLAFEANEGQGDPAARFLARGHGYTLALAPDALTLALPTPLRFAFPGANPAPALRAEQPLPGVVNSFVGDDPSRWQVGIPTSARVRYTNLYPGLDLIVYGTKNGGWEYDVVVAPGADPATFALSVDGATGVTLDAATGDLVLTTAAGAVRQHAPTIYQEVDGARQTVAGGYALREDGSVGFAVGGYDPTLPLVIDPTLVYSTFLGGSGYDEGDGIALDASGNAYVTGGTTSTNFPVTNGSGSGGGSYDAFVTKLDATGRRVYSTYLGGGGDDRGYGIAVDTGGNAYVTGYTTSTNFPVTNGSVYGGGLADAFVTKLNGSGARVYSTYLGGGGSDGGSGIAVDTGGNAYVTGATKSMDFPVTNGSTFNGNGLRNDAVNDGFVTKLSASGVRLYSTYLGGSGDDAGYAIAVDGSGDAYVTGYTGSANFPVTTGATFGGYYDVFVTKLNGSGARVYSTLFGGGDDDTAYGIALDASGNAYVAGYTASANFPVTNGSTYGGGFYDAFVTKLDATGARVYSTFLGGSDDDYCYGIAVDTGGNAFVTGGTASANFPVTNGSTLNGTGSKNTGSDAFVTMLDGTGARIYSTYLGGSGDDVGDGIAVDGSGNAYVIGYTGGANFPVTTGATFGGGAYDAFVAKIVVTSSPPPAPNPLPPPQPGPAPSGQPAALPQARPTVPVISAPNPLPARRP